MKTKLTSFLLTTLLFSSINVSMALASGFYDKNLVRGFISIGGEYRSMGSEHMNYVNGILFKGASTIINNTDTSTILDFDSQIDKYGHFNGNVIGLNLNVGAEYKQLISWFNFHLIPTQVSKKPSNYGDFQNRLYDARWFSYGADWMFGWMLLHEKSIFNIIPSVGLGMSLLNIHFASNYALVDGNATYSITDDGKVSCNPEDVITIADRYYSNFSSAFHAELEFRIKMDPISIGVYGGYRYVSYGPLSITSKDETITYVLDNTDTDISCDSWFIGARLTWTFLSNRQRELKIKL